LASKKTSSVASVGKTNEVTSRRPHTAKQFLRKRGGLKFLCGKLSSGSIN
jgi:hypothetical protein